MFENVDFSENTRGSMRRYEDLGPFVHLLATDLGQVGFHNTETDGTCLLHVEPFSQEAAETLAASLDSWVQPDVSLNGNRPYFSLVAAGEPVCRQQLQAAIKALLQRGGSAHVYLAPAKSSVAWARELLDAVHAELGPAALVAGATEEQELPEEDCQGQEQEVRETAPIDEALEKVLALSPAQRQIVATIIADPEIIAGYQRRMGQPSDGSAEPQKWRSLTFGEPGHEGEYCLKFEEYNDSNHIPWRIERALRRALPDWQVDNWGPWMEIRPRSNDGRRDDETIFAAVRALVGEFTFSAS